MGLIGSIVGSTLGLGTSIFGGVKASQAINDSKNRTTDNYNKTNDMLENQLNEDKLQRSSAVNLLTEFQKNFEKRNKQASSTAAVTGASEESIAAQKAANNDSAAQIAANLAAMGDREDQQTRQQIIANNDAYTQQMNNYDLKKADEIAKAAQAASNSVQEIGNQIPW